MELRVNLPHLLGFLRGKGADPELLMKDVEAVMYMTAKRMSRPIGRDAMLELRSVYLAEIFSKHKPVPKPLFYALALAKRTIYAGRGDFASIEEYEETLVDQVHAAEYEHTDFIVPVKDCYLHPELRKQYIDLVEGMPVGLLMSMAISDTLLGNMLLSAFFSRIGSVRVFSSKEDREDGFTQSASFLTLSPKEEEVLLGCILFKVGKKWVIPQYILMRDAFFISLFNYMGAVYAPGQKEYFRHLLLGVRIYCQMERLLKSYEWLEATKICGKRFSLRIRDVENRYQRIERIMSNYERINTSCIKQLERESRHLGSQSESDSIESGSGDCS